MKATLEICAKITPLTAAQAQLLATVSDKLQLASDIAQAHIFLYTMAADRHYFVVAGEARPNTVVSQRRRLLGITVPVAEEPLVCRTYTTGQGIAGRKEWALGVSLEQKTYPVRSGHGEVIGVLSFEKQAYEQESGGHDILTDTVNMLVTGSDGGENLPASAQQALTARDGVIIVDRHGMIVFANEAAASIYKMFGVGRLVGRRASERRLNLRLVSRAREQRQYLEQEYQVEGATVMLRVIPLVQDGAVDRCIVIVSDVTELRKKERELLVKQAVIQEIHHRVKNNLQTIASLLRLQARRASSPAVKAALREGVNRIMSISVVHEFLSQQDAEYIDIMKVTRNILDQVIQNMLEPGFNIQTVQTGEQIILPSEQAASLALVINELIQNSLEHGFTGREEGVIGVDVRRVPAGYQIDIFDDGVGLPPDFDIDATGSLGLQIVRTLVREDLHGEFSLQSQQGTRARIVIPPGKGGQ